MSIRILLALAFALVLAVAACGDDSDGVAAMDTSKPWDLVWFSDSTGFGAADRWAERIQEELGVEVRVHDESAGGLSAVTVLEGISEEGSEVRKALADAEIVVFWANPEGSGADTDLDVCMTDSPLPRDPPERSSMEDWAPYRPVVRQIYETIFEVRSDEPTIVRAYDFYNPVISGWEPAGIREECIEAWDALNRTISEAAAEFGVPVAAVYDAFNGPDHDQDPREAGLIGGDGLHPSEQGTLALVDALDALGYEPVIRGDTSR